MTAHTPPLWTDAIPEASLPVGTLRTWKKAGFQIVLGRSAAGELFALDNRCPHEGYPLAQGDLKDRTLTCCWHNWKFDVQNGACIRGGEDVRTYPVRASSGMIQVDLTPPALEPERQRLRDSLAVALTDGDLERALRDGVRLLQLGTPAVRILGDVALHDTRHAEYGATHVLALAAETRHLLQTPTTSAADVLAPLLELACDTNQRRPARSRPAPARCPEAPGQALRQAVEDEDLDAADAILQGAWQSGYRRDEITQWLFGVCSDHFLSFGHSLIYLVKSSELLDLLPEEDAPEVLAGLLFQMGNGTREDTLPYLRGYFLPVKEWEAEFERWTARAAPMRHGHPQEVIHGVLDGKRDQAMACVREALEAGWTPVQIAHALVVAAARRLLRFDAAWDGDPTVQEGWLSATHRLTFASAVRHAMQRFDAPERLRFLFQAAAFIHSAAPLDRADASEDEEIRLEEVVPDLDSVRDAVSRRDPDAAVRAVATQVARQGCTPELVRILRRAAVEVPLIRPIFRVHGIKTLLAGLEETQALADAHDAALPLLAAVRFLASPVQERPTESAARAAVEWVEHGRMLRKLTQ